MSQYAYSTRLLSETFHKPVVIKPSAKQLYYQTLNNYNTKKKAQPYVDPILVTNQSFQLYRRQPTELDSFYPVYPSQHNQDQKLVLHYRFGNIEHRTLRGYSDHKDQTVRIKESPDTKLQQSFTRSRGFTETGDQFIPTKIIPQNFHQKNLLETSYSRSINHERPKDYNQNIYRKFQNLPLPNQPSRKWYRYYEKKETF